MYIQQGFVYISFNSRNAQFSCIIHHQTQKPFNLMTFYKTWPLVVLIENDSWNMQILYNLWLIIHYNEGAELIDFYIISYIVHI